MSDSCKWLHEQLEQLPIIKFPFTIEQLPENGIYFFYENDEIWGHDGNKSRIVRIGTSKDGNFKSRIKEHYLLDESKMNFDQDKPKPSDRSIFRKHIGRALLSRDKEDYLPIWDIDFMKKENIKSLGHKRNIDKEKRIESEITRILRERFSFRFIMMDTQIERMGSKGLESSLIGTVASCKLCKPSNNWLGKHSPKKQIKESGLWLVQHLEASGIRENDKETILNAIRMTKNIDYKQYYDLENFLFNIVKETYYEKKYLTAFDFFCIIIWKANRAKSKIAKRLIEKGYETLDEAVYDLSSNLYRCDSDESRLKYLITEWEFRLPMASAILTVLYPEDFTVYDRRVCNMINDFYNLDNITNFSKLWTYYLLYKRKMMDSSPKELSLRDKDRYLWGKSFCDQLNKNIEDIFLK